MYILENPSAGWAYYILDARGRILAFSNSLDWCERTVARFLGR